MMWPYFAACDKVTETKGEDVSPGLLDGIWLRMDNGERRLVPVPRPPVRLMLIRRLDAGPDFDS